MIPANAAGVPRPASLIVTDPSGNRSRVPISVLPFKIGRQAGNQLVVRDSRISRNHARLLVEGGEYVLEDIESRHGVFVNGQRVEGRQKLQHSDRIDFGFTDSYHLIFQLDGKEMNWLLGQIPAHDNTGVLALSPAGDGLARLRAVLEVARALETSLSTHDVLVAVVDAALAVTGAERGFLLLRSDGELEMRVARDRHGAPLSEADLRVPRNLIRRALAQRRDLLSMNFDPQGSADRSIADLELRSVVCVPLVRVRLATGDETAVTSTDDNTAGVLYMDSRLGAADLSSGNRELLQTLAIEASTILENARLLEEEQTKRHMEEELSVARKIQQSLLPRSLPDHGWFTASGTSIASHQVGGDYFDVFSVDESRWAAIVADVSGKGVSSALLASLLQGAFFAGSNSGAAMEKIMERLGQFLDSRTSGDKYATIFYCVVERSGVMRYINAGHCPPFVLSCTNGTLEKLESTGMPVGLFAEETYRAEQRQLSPGDKVVIYTDGILDAVNASGEFFGLKRLTEVIRTGHGSGTQLYQSILETARSFTEGARQADDLTLVVLEYRG